MTTQAMSKSEELSRYCLGLTLASVPTEVKQKATLCILDASGCMIAGSAGRVGKIITTHALEWGKPGTCTVFGRSSGVDVEAAALANGTLGHVLELDDGHRPSDNHLGGVVVSAAFAAAEQAGASGADMLKAVIVGY